MARTARKRKLARSAALEGLLYQGLETELGGADVYACAIELAVDARLRAEWSESLVQTQGHAEIARTLLETAGLDPDADAPSRASVRAIDEALIDVMERARAAGPEAAQLVAAQCVVLAETADHAHWQMVGVVAHGVAGAIGRALRDVSLAIETEGDWHLTHTTRWIRSLQARSLGLGERVPPPRA